MCESELPLGGYATYDPITDILLTVVFNFPNFSIIPLLETLLRPLFSRIIYCGFTPKDNITFKNIEKYRNDNITIYTYTRPEHILPHGFAMGQKCALMSMKRNSNVKVSAGDNYKYI